MVAAKRLGPNWHSLIYTGPEIHQHFVSGKWSTTYSSHTNLHDMVLGARNFIGIEVNKFWHPGDFDISLRPQMRLAISD